MAHQNHKGLPARRGVEAEVDSITLVTFLPVIACAPIPRAVSHLMPMAALSMLCLIQPANLLQHGCMSGKTLLFITCWCQNGKQLQPGRDKVGKITRRHCCLLAALQLCQPRSTTWHGITGIGIRNGNDHRLLHFIFSKSHLPHDLQKFL